MSLSLKFCVLFIVWLAFTADLWAQGYRADDDQKEAKEAPHKKEHVIDPPIPIEPIVVRVTGYGAFEKSEDVISEPKRLLALRASKLDAFRTLAERVYGTTVTGTSTVQDFVLKHDGFGTVVDTVVRGARVVSITEKKGSGFETVLELLLPGNFHDCLTKVNSFRNGSNCLRPLPQFNAFQSADAQAGKSNRANNMSTVYYLQ